MASKPRRSDLAKTTDGQKPAINLNISLFSHNSISQGAFVALMTAIASALGLLAKYLGLF